MRQLFDSVTASAIPADAQMVAGYVDGWYRWSASDWARFPHAVKVRIAVHASTNDGHVLDIEQGDATPAQGPGWVQMRRAAGADPSVYCSLAVWGEVRDAFSRAGVPQPHYWIAAYPGNGANLYPGSVAHQYRNSGFNGENVDISVVADYWPGVDIGDTLNEDQNRWLQSIFIRMGGDHGFNGNPLLTVQDVVRMSEANITAAVNAIPSKISAGAIDLAAVAKAVNDDAARRLES